MTDESWVASLFTRSFYKDPDEVLEDHTHVPVEGATPLIDELVLAQLSHVREDILLLGGDELDELGAENVSRR